MPQPDELPEAQWAAGIRSGDSRAFEALFRSCYGRLFQYAGRLVRDPQTAEDIVQEVFVKLWAGRVGLAIHTSLRAYLYTAVRNGCFNHIQHLQVRESRRDEIQQAAAPEPTPDQVLEARDFERAVGRAVEALPPACREAFLLRKQDNLSYAEIAELQGVSVNTVKTQLSRALKALLKFMPGQ
ncbi:RNA polymerase sigma-70 factor [bacterium]|nr:RNA polymerase sigma-70 factor [bacterium]